LAVTPSLKARAKLHRVIIIYRHPYPRPPLPSTSQATQAEVAAIGGQRLIHGFFLSSMS
jgi:hypothetical protein